MPHFKWRATAVAVFFSAVACDSSLSPRLREQRATDLTGSDTAGRTWTWPKPSPVTQVAVSPSAPRVIVGQSLHAAATGYDANGNTVTGYSITWSTEDSSIATVDADGNVRAVAVGSTRLAASIGGMVGGAT